MTKLFKNEMTITWWLICGLSALLLIINGMSVVPTVGWTTFVAVYGTITGVVVDRNFGDFRPPASFWGKHVSWMMMIGVGSLIYCIVVLLPYGYSGPQVVFWWLAFTVISYPLLGWTIDRLEEARAAR
ncbi:MAG: hypothetical protein HYW33_00680 [Candidatus Blackburnbacteria bacterium]|nr:hypothetical protein [Candidatus Blackburnbacteria bacterium]